MGVGPLVVGVDGGNSKTDLAVATLEGEPLAYVRGPGTNSHALGANHVAAIVGSLLSGAQIDGPIAHAALFLCGVDTPSDHAELTAAFAAAPLAEHVTIRNDTFALLHSARRQPDAVAVVCGAGINAVGEASDGRSVQYPGLGWESGDWGGAEMLGREALFLAARSEDGRGAPSVLPELISRHFAASVTDVGTAVHYRRMPVARLGELAPEIIAASEHDSVAAGLLDRLIGEIVGLARRSLRDLALLERDADVVLGGGMLPVGGRLLERVVARIAIELPAATPLAASAPPVTGAVLAALRSAGAPPAAADRLRRGFRDLAAPARVSAKPL